MKRILIGLVLVSALVVGCTNDSPKPSPAPSPAPSKAGSTKKPSLYFEVPKDGTVYVMGTVEALKTLRETGSLPKTVTDKTIDPDGQTVIFDASSDEMLKHLQSEYKSQHKKK